MLLKQFCVPFQWGFLRHVMLEWKRCLRDEFDLLSRFLYPTENFACYYPGEDDGLDKGYDVRMEPDGKIIGFVEGYSHRRIELMKADILIYKFDLKLFRQEMCKGFNLKSQSGEIDRWDRVIPWGTWEPEKGISFPIALFLGDDSLCCSFREKVMAQALQREAAGEIVITPDRTDWTDDIEELARKNKVLLVPLNEIIQSEDGKLLPTPEWEKYLTAFYKMIERDLPSTLAKTPEIPPFEFRRKGEMWVIRYEGEDMYLKDSVGLQCISQLLAKPNDPIFVMELRAIVSGQKPETVTQPQSRDDVVDQKTLSNLKRRYLELQTDLEEAQREGNTIIETEIEEEMERIIQYLSQIKAKGGEIRKVSDDFEKSRSATSKAFWRTVNLIRNEQPQFATHLEKCCVVGMVCNYTPERPVNWVL